MTKQESLKYYLKIKGKDFPKMVQALGFIEMNGTINLFTKILN